MLGTTFITTNLKSAEMVNYEWWRKSDRSRSVSCVHHSQSTTLAIMKFVKLCHSITVFFFPSKVGSFVRKMVYFKEVSCILGQTQKGKHNLIVRQRRYTVTPKYTNFKILCFFCF